MTVVCELLRFGAAQGWVTPAVVRALAEPKFLVQTPPGFNVGEEGQFRGTRAKTIKFAVPHGGCEWLVGVVDRVRSRWSRFGRFVPIGGSVTLGEWWLATTNRHVTFES